MDPNGIVSNTSGSDVLRKQHFFNDENDYILIVMTIRSVVSTCVLLCLKQRRLG